MVRAGVRAISENGSADLATITIDAAALDAGLPRSSSYRAWQNDGQDDRSPQERFRIAVATRILSGLASEHAAVVDAISATLLDASGSANVDGDGLASLSKRDREQTLARVVAAGSVAAVEHMSNSALWHAQISLITSLHSQENPPPELVEAMRAGGAEGANRYVSFFRSLLTLFGMRMRSPYQIEHVVLSCIALTEGLALRESTPLINDIRRPEPHADETRWNLFGVALLGLLKEFCEPDPTSSHPTDPANC